MTNNHLYSDRKTRLNTLLGELTSTSVGKYEHWNTLQQAKAEYDNLRQGRAFDIDAFYAWIEEAYGIRLEKIEGMIGPSFNIVDEHKYLIYKLRFER